MTATPNYYITQLATADQATRARFDLMCSFYEPGTLTESGKDLLAGLASVATDEDAARWDQVILELDRAMEARRRDTD